MGPKFVIVFTGVSQDSVLDFINDIKDVVEELKISLEENENLEEVKIENQKMVKSKTKKKKKEEPQVVSPILNFVVSTYYKGTGIEEVLKKLENYIDEASSEENEISNI